MKLSLIVFITIVLADTALAIWCGCWEKLFVGETWTGGVWERPESSKCCLQTTGADLMGGTGFLGLTGKNWCDTGSKKSPFFRECCASLTHASFYSKCV